MELERITYLGTREDWGATRFFGVANEELRQHCLCLGRTGQGKSTLLLNVLVQWVATGRGCSVIDPHGELAEELLEQIPGRRFDDVVYFNPADVEYPVGLNPLERRGRNPHLVVSGVLAALKHQWGDSWGPRMEYLLAMALTSLVGEQNATLLSVVRLFTDAAFRGSVLRRCDDPVVRRFWTEEYERYDQRFRTEAIAPIQNKLGRLVGNRLMRNVLGQVHPKIDVRFMLDTGRILIANLAKGALGEDTSNLLGSLLVTEFQLAAMARTDMPQKERVDHLLVIDESHCFTSDVFAQMLAELRKYRLAILLSGQYLEQFRQDVQAALLGNVGTLISFAVGAEDAKRLALHFDDCPAQNLVDLDPHQVLIRLTESGRLQVPFRGHTLPPIDPFKGGRGAELRALSRQKYARRRSDIEGKIERWLKAA